MPYVGMSNSPSNSHDGSVKTNGSSPNPRSTNPRRHRACESCRARKVKCRATSEPNAAAECCASRKRSNSKSIPRLGPPHRMGKSKPYRGPRSLSQEDDQELPSKVLQDLSSLLYLTTITSSERSLLSAIIPPAPNTHSLDLNAFMRGQTIPNAYDQGTLSSSPSSPPLNDFDVFFDLDAGSDGTDEMPTSTISSAAHPYTSALSMNELTLL